MSKSTIDARDRCKQEAKHVKEHCKISGEREQVCKNVEKAYEFVCNVASGSGVSGGDGYSAAPDFGSQDRDPHRTGTVSAQGDTDGGDFLLSSDGGDFLLSSDDYDKFLAKHAK